MKTDTRSGKELLDLVGRRVLLRKVAMDAVMEATVIERSPKGLVKLSFGFGHSWEDPEDYWLVEVLPRIIPEVPPNPFASLTVEDIRKIASDYCDWDRAAKEAKHGPV